MTTNRRIDPAELPRGPLVSTEWLADCLGAANLRIIDVRGEVGGQPPAKRAEYDQAHIPGAAFANWTVDFVDVDDPRPTQLASAEAFRACAERLGIGDDDVVVTYDDYFDIFAGRVWWAMRTYGHAAVRVLDGGWRTWVDEGRATTMATPNLPPTTFTPRPVPSLYRTLAETETALAEGVMLIDARPRHLYDGDRGTPRTGHIPGAVNLPYTDLVDAESGLFRSQTELRAAVVSAGIDPDNADVPVISSCGSGVSASVVCMALELLGRRNVPVFDGSFAEWAAELTRPIAQALPVEAG